MNKVTVKKTVTKYLKLRKDFVLYSKQYVAIRNRVGGTMINCFHCGKKPQQDSTIGLLFTDKGNKMVCCDCAEIIEKELVEEPPEPKEGREI